MNLGAQFVENSTSNIYNCMLILIKQWIISFARINERLIIKNIIITTTNYFL